jgi:hypothetical protein
VEREGFASVLSLVSRIDEAKEFGDCWLQMLHHLFLVPTDTCQHGAAAVEAAIIWICILR